MTAFDYTVLAILGCSILIGLMRGAIREIFSVLGWMVAFYAAKSWNPRLIQYVPEQIPGETFKVIAAFVVAFLLVLLCCSLISLLLTTLLKAVGLGGANRLLGGFVGSVRGLLLIGIVIILAGMTEIPKDVRWTNAMLSAPLEALVVQCLPWLPDSISQRVHLGQHLPLQV